MLRKVTLVLAVVVGFARADRDSCSRYGGASCCPDLDPLEGESEEYTARPLYVAFLPKNNLSETVDNICHTFFPLPDNSGTFILYISWVFNDGSNEVFTYVTTSPDGAAAGGVGRELQLRAAQCGFGDTIFAQAECGSAASPNTVNIVYRCALFGDCPVFNTFRNTVPIFGLSFKRQPIGVSCWNKVMGQTRNNGLPDGDYYSLPMRLPSRCVFNQMCSVAPALYRFRRAVGATFPGLKF